MGKFLSRSFEIISSAIEETGKEYTSNLTSLINDARTVRNTLTKAGTDASDTLARLKSSNTTKKISDWFYGEESSFESSGDDFDPGFKIDDSNGSKLDGEEKPRELTFESMTDISNKQNSTMVKVGRRQTEQSVANTAEIVSTLNSRSSEMIASINNINKTLITINSNVEKLVQLQTVEGIREQQEIDKGGLFSDGQLSLGRIFEASKNSVQNNRIVSTSSMFMQLLSGGTRPEDIATMALSLGTGKQMKVLGGHSIDEIGKGINEAIGTATQSVLNEMISSKAFKKVFGDITSFDNDKDYGQIVTNTYDTKKAVFDGMTRNTIVNIIPEYLAKINESISGISYYVDNSGKLVKGSRKNEFVEVTNNAIASSGISSASRKNINNVGSQLLGEKFREEDIDMAGEILVGVIVHRLHDQGTRNISTRELKEHMSEYITPAVETLCAIRNDPDYWARVCQIVLLQATRGIGNSQKFIQNINQSLQNMISSAIDFAQSGKQNANQASRITMSMIQKQFVNKYNDRIETKDDKPNVDGRIKRTEKPYKKYTDNEYLSGIFGVLNRGINVKVVEGGKKRYGSWKIRTNPETQTESDDDTFGKAIAASLSGADSDKDLFKDTISKAISETTRAMMGADVSSSNNNGGHGGGGFLSGLLSTAGGLGLNTMLNRALSGTLSNDVKNLFGQDGEIRKTASNVMGKVKNIVGKATGPVAYDSRVQQAGELITGEDGIVHGIGNRVKKAGSKISEKLNGNASFRNARDSVQRFANNNLYHADSRALKAAKDRVTHTEIDTETISNLNDRGVAEFVIQCIKDGNLEDAETMVDSIEDSKLSTALRQRIKDFKKIKEINEKREKGETAVAEGETPSIGSVLQTAPEQQEDENKPTTMAGKIFGVVKKGFGFVGKFLGKIAKATAKLAADGAMNFTYGMKTMMEGFFGGKRRDQNGEVILDENGNPVKDRGIVGNAVKAAKLSTTAIANIPKNIVKGVKNLHGKAVDKLNETEEYTDSNGETKERYTSKFSQWAHNTTATGARIRDENGNKVIDENTTKSIADLIAKPGKVLGETLKNIAGSVKLSGSKLGESLKKAADKLGSVKDKIFGKKNEDGEKEGGILNKIKNSKLVNNSLVNGMTQGFKQAKAAKEKMKNTIDEKKARGESYINDAVGTIKDVFTGKSEGSIFDTMVKLLSDVKDTINQTSEDQIDAINEANGNIEEDESSTASDGSIEENPSTIDSGSTGSTTQQSSDSTSEGSSTPVTSSDSGSSDAANSARDAVSSATEGSTGGSSTVSDSSSSSSGSGKSGGLISAFKDIGKDIMGSLGKILGGFGQALFGLVEMVISAVMALEGIQQLMDLFNSILSDGLAPLNEIFEVLIDSLTPMIDSLKGLINTIVEPIVILGKTIVEIITPIFTAVKSVFDQVAEILNGLFESFGAMLDSILTPFMGIFESILMPIIEGIGYTLDVISGVLQLGMGGIIGLLGMILKPLGALLKVVGAFPILGSNTAGEAGDGIASIADTLVDQGKQMMEAGFNQLKRGIVGLSTLALNMIPGVDIETPNEQEQEKEKVNVDQVHIGTDFGSGDTNTVNNSWSYTYGSGNTTMNQHTYGNYMNMSQRGCGPIALADAYSRRSGGSVNPVALASKMMGAGAYEPNKGTSVSSMVSVGNSMGMGMRAGGVTQSSLKHASPTNPITLLGSGTGFGTKYGNNHYVNVIGTDKHGGAYIANPMSGRVERQSATSLVLNSKLGLYGSGDENEFEEYGFNDETTEALDRLRTLTSKLTEMFTGPSTSEKIEKEREKYKDDATASRIKTSLGDDYDAVEQEALNDLKSKNPKRDGESDEEYQARIDKLWGKNKSSLIIKFGGQAAADKDTKLYEDIESGAETAKEGINAATEAMKAISVSVGGSSASSFTGAVMSPYSPITYKETNITKTTSGESPVHDYFSQTSGSKAYTINGGWWNKTDDPNKEGEGQKGDAHEGVIITFTDPDEAEVKAITEGTVTYVGRGGKHGGNDPNGGLGNHVKWRDKSGMYHWYMHLADIDDEIQEGSNLSPNQVIGHPGDTGATGSKNGKDLKFLRYVLTKNGPYGNTGDPGYMNPFTYWKYDENGGTGGSSVGGKPGAVTADNGAVLCEKYGPYTYTDVNMDDYTDSPEKHTSKHSPLHEFFSKSSGKEVYTSSGGFGHWFWNRANPDKTGRGQKDMGSGLSSGGVEHGGVDFAFGRYEAGAEIHAPTGGKVTVSKSSLGSDGAGHQIAWTDSGGKSHWMVHLRDKPLKNVGDTIEAGDLIGYSGQSGGTSGGYNHLHYVVIDPEYAGVTTCRADAGMENPINYFKNYTPTVAGNTTQTPTSSASSSNTSSSTVNSGNTVGMSNLMSNNSAWGVHKNNPNVSKFISLCNTAGMSSAQAAVMMSTGIWEDGGEKIFGDKSLTATTYDVNGQQAVGIMNWVDKNVDYGNTVEDQLRYIYKTYFDGSSSDYRAKMRDTGFDGVDLQAFKAGTGRSDWGMSYGENYGPVINTDIIAGSEQFFRGALVPGCIHDTSGIGVAKYIGTAVDAYNWILQNGLGTGSAGGGGSPRFIASYSNDVGGGIGGNTEDLIRTAAMIYEGYSTINPNGTYGSGRVGPIKLRDGSTVESLRPDCSGFVEATIQHMGYKLPNGYYDIPSFFSPTDSPKIYESDGKTLSKDWKIISAADNDFVPGDFTNTDGSKSSSWYHQHVSMPLIDQNGYCKGFDGGGTTNIQDSMRAAKKYLDGDSSYVNDLHSGMPPSASLSILRYLGGSKSGSDNGTAQEKGGFTNAVTWGGSNYMNKPLTDTDEKSEYDNMSKPSYEINPPKEKDKETTTTTTATNYSSSSNDKGGHGGGGSHRGGSNGGHGGGGSLRGSGDVDDIFTNNSLVGDIWYDSIFNNNTNPFIQDIPELDESKFVNEYNDSLGTNQVVVNKYEITPKYNTDIVDKMSKMTFNVRAQRVEQLLEKLIEIVDEKKNNFGSTKSDGTSADLFTDHSIPESIVRLSRG